MHLPSFIAAALLTAAASAQHYPYAGVEALQARSDPRVSGDNGFGGSREGAAQAGIKGGMGSSSRRRPRNVAGMDDYLAYLYARDAWMDEYLDEVYA